VDHERGKANSKCRISLELCQGRARSAGTAKGPVQESNPAAADGGEPIPLGKSPGKSGSSPETGDPQERTSVPETSKPDGAIVTNAHTEKKEIGRSVQLTPSREQEARVVITSKDSSLEQLRRSRSPGRRAQGPGNWRKGGKTPPKASWNGEKLERGIQKKRNSGRKKGQLPKRGGSGRQESVRQTEKPVIGTVRSVSKMVFRGPPKKEKANRQFSGGEVDPPKGETAGQLTPQAVGTTTLTESSESRSLS